MRLPAAAVAFLIGTLASQARTPAQIDFGGAWWSLRCSTVELTVTGDVLGGNYYASAEAREAGRSFPLIGYRAGTDLIAFVVIFRPTGSVAAWVGQHTLERGTEKIIAQFHLTMDVADADELELLWSSIVTGTDTFLRIKPSNCR